MIDGTTDEEKVYKLTRRKIEKDIRKKPDVKQGMLITLMEILMDERITIDEFKEYCNEFDIDYNNVEHCCACCGCYDEGYDTDVGCPDFEYENCKIRDPHFCEICGTKAEIGYPLTDDKGKEVYTFWTCEKHSNDEKIEAELRKGTSIETIFQKFNK